MSPSGKRRLDRANSKAEATTGQGVLNAYGPAQNTLRRDLTMGKLVTTVWSPKDTLTLVACMSLFALVVLSMILRDANSGTLLIAFLAVVASIPGRS